MYGRGRSEGKHLERKPHDEIKHLQNQSILIRLKNTPLKVHRQLKP